MKFIAKLLQNDNKLDPDLGRVTSTPKLTLSHWSEKELVGHPHTDSKGERLIPNSFSLGDGWWFMGEVKTRFSIPAGTSMMVVNRRQFYNWGDDVTTPMIRGALIYQWARLHGIKVIKLELKPIQPVEYAVLDTSILTTE